MLSGLFAALASNDFLSQTMAYFADVWGWGGG